jgi:hypothetical protein
MKIVVVDQSCVQTHVTAADADSDPTEIVEISEAEWKQFNDVEERYEQLLAGFRQRQLAQQQEPWVKSGSFVRVFRSSKHGWVWRRLPLQWPLKLPKPHNPVDETDWGMGVGGREKPQNPTDFRNELADLRDRTTEKRARRGS